MELNELKEKLNDSLEALSKIKDKNNRSRLLVSIEEGFLYFTKQSEYKDKFSSEEESFFQDLINANLSLPKSSRIEWGYGLNENWSFTGKLSKPVFEYFPKSILESKEVKQIFSYKEGMTLSPNDMDLNKVLEPFIGDDDLRPMMQGISFDEYGATATNAHILIHLGGKTPEQGVFFPLNAKNKSNRNIEGRYPNYSALIQSDYELITTIDTQELYNAINVFIKASLINNTTKQIFIKVEGLKDFNDSPFEAGFNAEYLKDTLTTWLMMGYKSLSIYNQDKNVNRQFLFVPNGIKLYERYAVQKQLLDGVFSIIMPVMKSYNLQNKASIEIKDSNTINLLTIDSKPFVMTAGEKAKEKKVSNKTKSDTQALIDDLMELMDFSDADEKKKLLEVIKDLKELQSFE